jgi:DNA (cytosine-5)-methyltransferase 1
MKHLDLFSGIGGFALAARWAGIETVGFCEIEEFPKKVLEKNFPGVPIHPDITTLDGRKYAGIDVITGGFPCQPFSTCGKEKGTKDPRHLWPEMLRVVSEARPTYVVAENVSGIVRLGLDVVQHDLESEGYASRAVMVPACAKGAKHRRDRVWIIAHSLRCVPSPEQERECKTVGRRQNPVAHGKKRELAGWSSRPRGIIETVGRATNGVPQGLDESLKALGNAIVPHVAYEIFRSFPEFKAG